MELIKIRPKSFGLSQDILRRLRTKARHYLYSADLQSVSSDYDLEDAIKNEIN